MNSDMFCKKLSARYKYQDSPEVLGDIKEFLSGKSEKSLDAFFPILIQGCHFTPKLADVFQAWEKWGQGTGSVSTVSWFVCQHCKTPFRFEARHRCKSRPYGTSLETTVDTGSAYPPGLEYPPAPEIITPAEAKKLEEQLEKLPEMLRSICSEKSRRVS